MASKTVQIYTSDLTGKEIGNTDELVEVRVLDHPDLDRPVRLDAYALEVQSLFDAAEQFVTVEVVVPGQPARQLVVPNEVFAEVFTTDVDAALAAAETYSPAGTAAPARRGRPAASGTAKRASTAPVSREQRGAIRDWANNNGFEVGNRGRIKDEVMAAFEAAHTN
jgi:hypothetical protein